MGKKYNMTLYSFKWFRLLFIIITTPVSSYPEFECPSRTEWKFRTVSKCTIPEGYHCLFNENTDAVVEFCDTRSYNDPAGHKLVLVGDLDRRDCEGTRYQPFSFSTNGMSACIFEKTYCKEEGLVIHTEGTADSDRQCRCDYTRSYAFIIKPEQSCYCVPSKEDCSCYKKPCPLGFIMTPDYECINKTVWTGTFTCALINYNGDSKHLKSMIFEGDGFAKFSLYLIDASYIDNIHLGFQSTQKGGVLLFINDKLKTLQVLISLSEGALHIEVSTRRGTTVLRSSKDTYHDGADHTLNVVFGNDVIEATTDHQDDTFEQELVRQEITSRIADGIYLGGLGVQSHSLSGKAKLRSFSGCISSFSISKKEIPLYMIEESKNVYYGKCSENIWRKCVKFTEQSKPIVYTQSKDANKVYLIVGKDSLGTLLHFKRVEGEDFDVTLFVESKGVEISDNKENKEYKLNSDDNIKDWHVISVEDTGDERLLVSLGTSSIEVPYNVPYRWFSSKELFYDVAVGGLLESDTSTLQGGISSLIINDRPIDLYAVIESHQLQHCVRSTMVLHEMDKEDKPVC